MSDNLEMLKGKLQIKGTLHFRDAEGRIISSVPFISVDAQLNSQEETHHGDYSNGGGQDRST